MTVLDVRQAAGFLKVSKSLLDKLRTVGGGPPFVRLSPRRVGYLETDLHAWLESRRVRSTSEDLAGV